MINEYKLIIKEMNEKLSSFKQKTKIDTNRT